MIKNGVEYSEYELDILKKYIENAETKINRYFLTGKIPDTIKNVTQLRDFLENVEIIYAIGCKYAASHNAPDKIADKKKTPFIKLNDLFNDDTVNDKNNILVLPNPQKQIVNSKAKTYFNNDMTDAEFKLIIEYNNKQELTKLEKEFFDKLTKKLHNYSMLRFRKIQKVYMENALVIGDNVTKFCVDKYPGLMKEEPNLGRIVTLEEIRQNISSDMISAIGWGVPSLLEDDYTRRPSYEKTSKYNVLKSQNIDMEIVQKTLNFEHKIGNYELTKSCAEKGLILDEAFLDKNKLLNLTDDIDKKAEINLYAREARMGAINDSYGKIADELAKDGVIKEKEMER